MWKQLRELSSFLHEGEKDACPLIRSADEHDRNKTLLSVKLNRIPLKTFLILLLDIYNP